MDNRKFAVTSEHIDRLKFDYHKSGYSLEKGAPDWLELIARMSERDLGVLALVGPTGVNVSASESDRDRLWPDAPSIYLAGLTGHVRSSKRRVSLGLPPQARDLPLFLACTSVLKKAFEASDSSLSSNARGVLIISPDIGLRSKYCDLLVDNERLESAYPGSRMLYTGKIQPLTQNTLPGSVSGVCFFLPLRKTLPSRISILPDLIILDLRYSRLVTKSEDLVPWVAGLDAKAGILALYTCGDRLSSTVLRKSNFIDFPLDHAGIQTCVTHNGLEPGDCSTGSLDLSLMNAFRTLSRKHVVSEVPTSKDLKQTIRDLTILLEQHRENSHIELNRIRWLFSIYSQMPTPLLWYENAARDRGRWIPKSAISRIGSISRDIGTLGPTLQTSRALLTNLNHICEEANPKAAATAKHVLLLSKDLSDDNRLLILVRDEIMQYALSSWLSLSEFFGEKWLEFVDIAACRSYLAYSHRKYRYFLSPGSLHYRYRWILGGDLGSHLHFLAYPHEIGIIDEQISQFYDKQYLERRATRRSDAMAKLTTVRPQTVSKEVISYPFLDLIIPKIPSSALPPPKPPLKKVASFQELIPAFQARAEEKKQEEEELDVSSDSTYEDVEEDIIQEYSVHDIDSILVSPDGVPCHKLTLISQEKGIGAMWIANHSYVEFVRPDELEDLYRCTPDQLQVGDLLLLVDQQQQQGIFERLVEIADNNPKMQYIAAYRNIWRKAIDLVESKFRDARGKIDYSKMHEALINAGIEITSIQTLQNWVNDVVIGPADVSSIVAIGSVSGVTELSRRSREFDKNFSRIRTFHRSVGRRVAHLVRNTFKKVASTDEPLEDSFDSNLGIPLDEVVQSIDVCEVRSVSKINECINPDLVGVFIKSEE